MTDLTLTLTFKSDSGTQISDDEESLPTSDSDFEALIRSLRRLDFLGPEAARFFLEACVSMLQQITHWNCFRAALGAESSFSSLVLVNWDRLIFFDPDA